MAVMDAVHLAHPARTDGSEDFIRAQALTGLDGHGLLSIADWANYITFALCLEDAFFRAKMAS
jgi:hypothetical protein